MSNYGSLADGRLLDANWRLADGQLSGAARASANVRSWGGKLPLGQQEPHVVFMVVDDVDEPVENRVTAALPSSVQLGLDHLSV